MGRQFGQGQVAGGRFGGPPSFNARAPATLPSIGFPALLAALQQQIRSTAGQGAAPMTSTAGMAPRLPGPSYGAGGERSFFPNSNLSSFKPTPPAAATTASAGSKPSMFGDFVMRQGELMPRYRSLGNRGGRGPNRDSPAGRGGTGVGGGSRGPAGGRGPHR